MENFADLKRKPGKQPKPPGDPAQLAEVKEFCLVRGITRGAVARRLGVSWQAVTNWWNGKLTVDRLEELKELVRSIEQWEQANGKQFGG